MKKLITLTTNTDNTFIASVFVANGGSDPTADAPMTELYGAGGSSIGSAQSSVGYIVDGGAAGSNALSFSGFSGSRPTVAAVSFAAAAVPEPATLGLLGAALGILAFIKRRR